MVLESVIGIVFILLFLLTLVSIVKGAPYVRTDKKSIKKIVNLASLTGEEKMVDLGSGDGRVVVAFAKAGAYAEGYEINPFLVLWSKILIKSKGLDGKARVYWKSMWNADLGDYDIVFIFGINYIMYRLEKKLLLELRNGARVITQSYRFPNWKEKSSDSGFFLYEK